MNLLEHHLIEANIDEVATMNWLQLEGLISDNCVWARDVADADCKRAKDLLLLADL